MMKMEIKLDEERIKRDGEYDVAELWARIDKEFENGCKKEVQSDGSVMYVGIPDKDYYTDIMVAAMICKSSDWFGRYCVKWIWYDNEDDEDNQIDLPFGEEDILIQERKDNPLFMRWC